MTGTPRLAFVHDWLTTWGGAEQVLAAALEVYPEAPVYTLIYRPEVFRNSVIGRHEIRTSFLDRMPFARSRHRAYLPLMPLAVEQFDLREFDVIVSISHAVAHGVLPQPGQLHINYICIPIRYAWHLHHDYLAQSGLRRGLKSIAARVLLHYVRLWDQLASDRVDHFVAISRWVARNVWRAYRRPADVIYPPVDVDRFEALSPREDYYITVSRLVPYKRVDLVVQAFARLGRRLVVVGDGPELPRLRAMAGENVRLAGWQSDESLRELLGRARAFVYAAEEDFGISPVEAQAAGCPVIAYGRGGASETVIDGKTGILYREQSVEALMRAVREFEQAPDRFRVEDLRLNAERFSRERFVREFRAYVEQKWDAFRAQGGDAR